MNKVILIGRLTRDPEIRTAQDGLTIARYSLAIDRQTKEKQADFFRCVTFGKNAEFVERYLKKGTKVAVTGRLQSGSYTDRDGRKVYTVEVVTENHEFVESKAVAERNEQQIETSADGFMNIPDGIDEELPFS